MQGIMAEAAERAGIPQNLARELAAEMRSSERSTIVRYLADRLHEAFIDRLDAPPRI